MHQWRSEWAAACKEKPSRVDPKLTGTAFSLRAERWKAPLGTLKSLTMSDASIRDHLANERTFLAWVRTSIALLGFGVLIAKLRFLVGDEAVVAPAAGHALSFLPAGTGARSTLLGLAFASGGLLTLLFAVVHYEQTRKAIDAENYHAARRVIVLFVTVVFLLGLASILYLLRLHPG